MEISQEMTLLSESGYCMPFHDHDEDVEMILMYGEQKHPTTGENFFHHGVDIKAHYYMLAALADGKVTGIGNDPKHGLYVIVLYDGKYSVKYAHLSGVHASFGQQVKAGTIVGVSGKDILHLEVRYMDEEINPAEFLAMLYANFKSYYANLKERETPEFVNLDMDVKTKYDDDQEEIQGLMLKFFIPYLKDLLAGVYQGGPHTAQSLRNLFTIGCNKHYFLDTIPSIPNPAGLTQRSSSLVGKVQDVLIGDFLSYLAVRHNCYLSSFTDSQKKNLNPMQ